MKKLLILAVLALALVVSAVACGGDANTAETNAATNAATDAETTVTTGDATTEAATDATTGDVATDAPATGDVATDAPATGDVATDDVATDAPATDAPAVDTDAPATDAPATDAPATDAPATEAPETDAPATEAPETDAPETEAPVEPYAVDMTDVTITGAFPTTYKNDFATVQAMHETFGDPTCAIGNDEEIVLLFYGSIGMGTIDLSKYNKVTITYATPNNPVADQSNDQFELTQKRVMLLNAQPTSDANSFEQLPEDNTIIASNTYTISDEGWLLQTVEIDLSDVTYNGEVFLTFDYRGTDGSLACTTYFTGIRYIVFS